MEYFLTIKSFKLNKPIPKINDELYSNLLSYSWPGNIRQLENYIENIVNLEGNISFDLWDEEHKKDFNNENIYKFNANENNNQLCENENNNLNLNFLERKTIEKAILKFGNNMTKTAKALGISRNTLYLKIKKYGIKTS